MAEERPESSHGWVSLRALSEQMGSTQKKTWHKYSRLALGSALPWRYIHPALPAIPSSNPDFRRHIQVPAWWAASALRAHQAGAVWLGLVYHYCNAAGTECALRAFGCYQSSLRLSWRIAVVGYDADGNLLELHHPVSDAKPLPHLAESGPCPQCRRRDRVLPSHHLSCTPLSRLGQHQSRSRMRIVQCEPSRQWVALFAEPVIP
jgi:hypothetical protein